MSEWPSLAGGRQPYLEVASDDEQVDAVPALGFTGCLNTGVDCIERSVSLEVQKVSFKCSAFHVFGRELRGSTHATLDGDPHAVGDKSLTHCINSSQCFLGEVARHSALQKSEEGVFSKSVEVLCPCSGNSDHRALCGTPVRLGGMVASRPTGTVISDRPMSVFAGISVSNST